MRGRKPDCYRVFRVEILTSPDYFIRANCLASYTNVETSRRGERGGPKKTISAPSPELLFVVSRPVQAADRLDHDFALIVCTGVLHHLVDPDAGLRALRSVAKSEGAIYLTGLIDRGAIAAIELWRGLVIATASSSIEANQAWATRTFASMTTAGRATCPFVSRVPDWLPLTREVK